METRNIKVTLEKAKEWYISENPILKELSLQAFTKEELEQVNLRELIDSLLRYYELTSVQRTQLESLKNRNDLSKISAPKLLRILACYFNGEFWKKDRESEGFFFYKKEGGLMNTYSSKIMDKYWCISSHTSVSYPTLVYFKKEEDCRKAYNIMKNLNKLDALYTDF